MNFNDLKNEIQNCTLCAFEHSPKPIVWGNHRVKIFHISQAPSLKANLERKPFVDKSGKTLRDWYGVSEDTFYNKDIFYLTALGHCYPGKKGHADAKPPSICANTWLKKELELVEADFYIIVGSAAAKLCFPGNNFTHLVFDDQELYGKSAIVLPHPSPANIKWFKDNPRFLKERLVEVNRTIKELVL
jgi:uracil-DNA glycosylase family 4